MLREFLERLCKEELEIVAPKLNEQSTYLLQIESDSIGIKDLDPGMALHAQICGLPTKRKEELFLYLMRANLLGQGTGGCRIGIDANEKFLTLSLGLPYEMNYQMFKDTIEDFANYLMYWRDTVAKFENEERI